MKEFNHTSVLLEESIDNLNIKPNGVYVDGTLGRGGHSLEIVKRLDSGLLIGIDQDNDALKVANETLKSYTENTKIVKSNYVNFDKVLDSLSIDKIDGMLLDLGVSSYQLDRGDRGFSFQQNYPLDMRMDQDKKIDAQYIVNNYSKKDLENIIFEYGEERWARRIAQFIVRERNIKPIETTFDLLDVIKMAIPAGARDKHPGIRTFQALRIEVNKELEVLENSIDKIVERLNKGGRLCIITFHSLEDRIVKNMYRHLASDCVCDPRTPICVCDKEAEIKIITRRPITPSDKEINDNNRSRSAKLRVAEKL